VSRPRSKGPSIEVIAAKVGDLPAMPQVAARAMDLIGSSRSTARELEEIISKDQATTIKVLRIANSAFYGVRGEISTLSRAIVVLGLNTLRSVIMTGVSEALHSRKQSSLKDRILWEHSVAAAIAAKTIAIECGYGAPEEAYVGGLLHDIGKVVMDANMTSDYEKVVEAVYNEGVSFVDAENEVFGFDHTDVGALVAERWHLAPPLREAVQFHHQPMGAEIDPTLCATVSLANSMCIKLGIGPERNPELSLADEESALMLTLAPERLDQISAAVKARLDEEKSHLSLA
jgi:putative nucleotidyltransferase with HDIG domain